MALQATIPGKEFFHTPCPKPVFSRAYPDSSVIAHELFMKYDLSVPFDRCAQKRYWDGVPYTSNDLYGWTIKLAEQKFSCLMPLLWDHLLNNPEHIIQADETPFLVLRIPGKEPGSKSYIWSYNTCKAAEHPIHVYVFEPGRSGDFPADKLLKFVGFLVTDAYPGYNKVANILRVLCWIHARRKFVEALPGDARLIPVSKQYTAVQKIDKFFETDREFQTLDAATRKAKRLEVLEPMIDDLYAWFEEIAPEVRPKSKLDEAIQYCKNHVTELKEFLSDGNLPLHNQVSELSMRPVAIGRKNYCFYGSPRGAMAGTCMYTLAETASANGLDTEAYFKFLMDHMLGNDFDRSVEYLTTLLPWSQDTQSACRGKLVVPSRSLFV